MATSLHRSASETYDDTTIIIGKDIEKFGLGDTNRVQLGKSIGLEKTVMPADNTIAGETASSSTYNQLNGLPSLVRSDNNRLSQEQGILENKTVMTPSNNSCHAPVLVCQGNDPTWDPSVSNNTAVVEPQRSTRSSSHPTDDTSDVNHSVENEEQIQYGSQRNGNKIKSSGRKEHLSELSEDDCEELAKYLDPDHGSAIKNWWHLASNQLIGLEQAERERLKRYYSGGGDPALGFLKRLCEESKDDKTKTIDDLITKCKKMQRNDVVSFLREQKKASNDRLIHLNDISDALREKLADRLNDKLIRGIKFWRHLASYYGYKRPEIDNMGAAIKEPNKYSPTRGLISIIQNRYVDGDFPLESLANALKQISRNDVVNVLEKLRVNKDQED